MKNKSFLFFLLLFLKSGYGQDLVRIDLSKDDSLNNIIYRYNSESEGLHKRISLIFKKDGSFFYKTSFRGSLVYSVGEWREYKELIELKCSYQKNEVPIKLEYNKPGRFINGFNVSIVRNTRMEDLTTVFVHINYDSIKCLPMLGTCNDSVAVIKRVKISFENGMSSKWVKIKKSRRRQRIGIVVSAPVSFDEYIVLEHLRFKKQGDKLIQL